MGYLAETIGAMVPPLFSCPLTVFDNDTMSIECIPTFWAEEGTGCVGRVVGVGCTCF